MLSYNQADNEGTAKQTSWSEILAISWISIDLSNSDELISNLLKS